MSIEDNKALVRRFFEEAWNKANSEAVDDCIAADRVSKSGVPGGTVLKRAITNWHAAFPDFAFQIVQPHRPKSLPNRIPAYRVESYLRSSSPRI